MRSGGLASPRRRAPAVVADSAAKMPPVCSQRAPSSPKSMVPVEVAGPSWLAAVWPRSEMPSAPRTPKPRSVKFRPLRAERPTPSNGTPADVDGVDAALQDQVFDQPPDVVVAQRGDDRRAQPEAAAQAARDVVFAAAFPGLEPARRANAPLARVEAEHDLAERNDVEGTLRSWTEREAHACDRSAWRTPVTIPTASAASRLISAKRRCANSSRGVIQLPPTARTDGCRT